MKKIVYFLWAFTLIITSCNEDLIVEITAHVTPPVTPSVITYDKAEGSFYGNVMGLNNTLLTLDFHNAANPNVGVIITGFCSLPTNFANFKCDEGTYNFSTTETAGTLMSGTMSGDHAIGTFLYDLSTNKRTLVTGGSITVAWSDNIYTIIANFVGVDAVTGNMVNDIKINYSGAIQFEDNSIIKNSTYTATGTPKWRIVTGLGPTTWSGVVEFAYGYPRNFYRITNWANLSASVFCNIGDNGTITIDDQSSVLTNSTHDYRFNLAWIIENPRQLLLVNDDPVSYNYFVKYNPFTKVLDFSDMINAWGTEYEALVGIMGYNKNTRDPEITLSDFYADLKLQLTPIETSPRNASLYHSEDLIGWLHNEIINPAHRSGTLRRAEEKPISMPKQINN